MPKWKPPGIPSLTDDRSIMPVLRALREIVETWTGVRPEAQKQAVVTIEQFEALEKRVKALEGP